jgi:hypothetical protein
MGREILEENRLMTSLLAVLYIFGIALVLHIAIHRELVSHGKISFRTTYIFIIGFLCLAGLLYLRFIAHPVTSFVLYTLLSLVSVILYLTPFLGGENPSSMMISSFKKKRQQVPSDLVQLFSNTGLIWKRIEDLRSAGLITKNGVVFVATGRGNVVSWLVSLYQKIFNRTLTG